MNGNLKLYQTNILTFKEKFYYLMNLLLSKQAETRTEALFYIIIFYLQILSSFFSESLNIFSSENGKSDLVLIFIKKIIRVTDLFSNYYSYFSILRIIVYILIPLFILHFLISCSYITRNSYYSYNCMIIYFNINVFFYILYNILCDIFFVSFCLGKRGLDENNNNINNLSCKEDINAFQIPLLVIFLIVILFLYIAISIFYSDSFFLTGSFLAKISCNYDIYWGINCLIISFLSTQAKFLTKEFFLIYNLIMSFILLIYFINHYLYYDKYINLITGIFHLLYFWTSIYCFVFAYIDFKEKGIVYIILTIIVCFFYMNIKNRIEAKIFLETPTHKINNKYYLLHYLRRLNDIINNIEKKSQYKSILSGIIRMHELECPNNNCILKNKDRENKYLYLPLSNKWNDPAKKEYEDEVFLKNFLIVSLNYFLYKNKFSVDMYLNLSLYHLKVIGNYCQAILFYKKASEFIQTLREHFSFIRLNICIQKTFEEKLKLPNEQCPDLENLDVSMYYKYDELSKNLLDEINNDVNLSLEFWKSFKAPLREASKTVNFDKIFELTDKIGKKKKNVEIIWNKLISIYDGINDFYDLYVEYVEQINDDDLKKRDLEAYRRKNESFGDHMSNNFYSVLFNKDTGIIIANGDKGSEGLIELSNKETENIFKYKSFELKGMNLNELMPNFFAKEHDYYISRYFKTGEKKIIDKTDFKTFGKDRNNSIMKLKLGIKLFPILNDKVYFVGLINKENIDDIILLDDKFNIQGMSLKLMTILNITNKNIFQENEIPFYVICRKFVNFYHIFFQGKKKGELNEKQIVEEQREMEDLHENIEINENVELEYEIKLPQFLIDFAEKTNKKAENNLLTLFPIKNDDQNDVIDEDNENDPLINEETRIESTIEKKFKNKVTSFLALHNNNTTTTKGNGDELKSEMEDSTSDRKDASKKLSEEEKLYRNLMNQYVEFFNEGKITELEHLIDINNKTTTSIEYKFNFTFDKFYYGNKKIAYIVRCIDNKNDIGKSNEESLIELDSKAAKYKKEKVESIKPLFEILISEKNDLISLQENFPRISTENKEFQKLLQKCKQIINSMSKIHGQKKAEIFEDENSSQTSQSGYDSGLVKKNRIEEIRSNLLTNISSFYTLKYIKLVLLIMGLSAFIFSIIFISLFSTLNTNLLNACYLNIDIFRSILGVSKIMNIFISIRVIFYKEVFDKYDPEIKANFYFNDYITEGKNLSIYYSESINLIYYLYGNIFNCLSYIEYEIPSYLNNEQLVNMYWNQVNISYIHEDYMKYIKYNKTYNDTFPMAINQLISDSIVLAENSYFNRIINNGINKTNYPLMKSYFDYLAFIVIENGYDNILPNQLKKSEEIPKILEKVNSSRTDLIVTLVCIFICIMISFCVLCSFLIIITNKSMSDGMERVSKIKLERIEEIIKRIKIFNTYLNRFRERNFKNESKEEEEAKEENNINLNGISNIQNEKSKSKEEENNNINNNNIGFNMDSKKYIPLTKLRFSFLYTFIILIIIIISVILILYDTSYMVKNTNQLLLVQKYIFGKLIRAIISTIDIKCFMSGCKNKKTLNFTLLDDPNLITEVIKGINNFEKISDYYNNKYLLDACGAIYRDVNDIKYQECKNDSFIDSSNNTDNILKLIDDWVDNIHKEDQMINEPNRRNLFKLEHFKNIEYMFYKYIFNVSNNFQLVVKEDLKNYLDNKGVELFAIGIIMGISTSLLSLFFGVIFIKKLIHHLSVSRIILKLIPTSVIISTQELESWIENKY